jgi:hypothetical protein
MTQRVRDAFEFALTEESGSRHASALRLLVL